MPLFIAFVGNDINSKAFVTTRAQLREENKQVQRAGKNVEKSKIKVTDIGLVDTQLEEGYQPECQLFCTPGHQDDYHHQLAVYYLKIMSVDHLLPIVYLLTQYQLLLS
jgi:hypothetical protein